MGATRVSKKQRGWDEDKQKALELMLRQFNGESNPTTLDLLGGSASNSHSSSSSGSELIEYDLEEFDEVQCLSSGWEKYLDLKTGEIYYMNSQKGTEAKPRRVFPWQKLSKLSSVEAERYNLKCSNHEGQMLDLNLHLSIPKLQTQNHSEHNMITCDDDVAEKEDCGMRLVGCPRCFMYLMVSNQDPRCPKCKGSFLLDFMNTDSTPYQ